MIADDHPVVQEGLVTAIRGESDMTVVGVAANGCEAIERFRQLKPDITLMDLRMPEVSGVEAIIAIRAEFPKARILVLTLYDGYEDLHRCLRAGAIGYLVKDASMQEILEAIRNAHRGQKVVPLKMAVQLAENLNNTPLTERERDVFQLLSMGASDQEIASSLQIAEKTVKAHTKHILTKLNVQNRTQAVVEALHRGILHSD